MTDHIPTYDQTDELARMRLLLDAKEEELRAYKATSQPMGYDTLNKRWLKKLYHDFTINDKFLQPSVISKSQFTVSIKGSYGGFDIVDQGKVGNNMGEIYPTWDNKRSSIWHTNTKYSGFRVESAERAADVINTYLDVVKIGPDQ